MMRHLGLVLAGGRSSRMGTDKALLKWGDKNLLAHAQNVLANSLCSTVIVSGAKHGGIADIYLDKGPLGGIHAACVGIAGSAWLSVIPVDMPLLRSTCLLRLQQLSQQQNRSCYFKHYQLPCVLNVNEATKEYIEGALQPGGDYSIKSLLKQIGALPVDVQSGMELINTNTPQQWAVACQQYKGDIHVALG